MPKTDTLGSWLKIESGSWNTGSRVYYYAEFTWVFVVGGSSNTGYLYVNYMDTTYGVRPVISLKSCVTWSKGDGTASSPYEVTVDSSCANAEN